MKHSEGILKEKSFSSTNVYLKKKQKTLLLPDIPIEKKVKKWK